MLLGQNLFGDVPDDKQDATIPDRRPPELEIAHCSIPADNTGDQSVPVALEQFLPHILDVPPVCRVRVGTLEPRRERRDILPGIPGDPGKRRVQVPTPAPTVHQSKSIRHLTEDREIRTQERVRRFTGSPETVGTGCSPAGTWNSIISRHCNRSSPVYSCIRARKCRP